MNENNIDQKFEELDNAVGNNSELIRDLFRQLKLSIDELESEDEEKYNFYRFQLHSKKASYFKTVGMSDEYQKEAKLVKTYSMKCQKQQQTEETFVQSIECDIQTDQSIENDIKQCVDNLKQFISEQEATFFDELQSTILQFTKLSVNSLSELVRLNLIYSSINATLNTMKTRVQMDLDESEGQSQDSLFLCLCELSLLLENLHSQRKMNFVMFVLHNRSKLRSILFESVPQTEERIQSHTKSLFVLFHPDKCRFEEKPMFTEVFQLIADDMSKQLRELSDYTDCASLVEHHEKIGKESWDIAVDYNSARKKKWEKLKRLERNILMNLSDKELEYHQHYHAIRAYEQYRAAARKLEVPDASKQLIVKKVYFKKCMALSLYLAGKQRVLEAQIYAIAGIHLAITSGNILSCKDNLKELEELLRKIHGANKPLFNVPNDSIEKRDESMLSKALVAYNHGSASLSQVENAISSELRTAILQRCSLRVEERKLAIPEESTLQVRQKGLEFIGKGVLGVGAGAVTTGVILVEAYADIVAGATLGTLFGGPIGIGTLAGIGAGLTCAISAAILGVISCKKSMPYLKEPGIRESLNKVMENVLKHYKEEQYSDVLNSLSVPYDGKKRLVVIREVKSGGIHKILLDIQPKSIVKELLHHDFPPESIAYFLVLLGEVLLLAPELKPRDSLPAEMCLELPSYSEFNYLATKVFEEVWINERLIARAHHIAEQIKSKISLAEKVLLRSVATTTLAYAYSVSKRYIEESLANPIMSRLEELKNIAQINYAISQIIIGGTGNLLKSVNTIREVKKKLIKEKDDKKMFPIAEIRLHALTDLLAAFECLDDLPSDKTKPFYDSSDFPELEGSTYIRTIDKVLMKNQMISRCESVILFDDEEADEFVLLDQLLGGVLKLDKRKFIEDVRESYNNNVQSVKSWAEKIIKKSGYPNFDVWESSFKDNKYPLTSQHLPILSWRYNLIFEPCIVKIYRDSDHIYVPTDETINFCTDTTTAASVYILIDKNNNSSDDKLIKGIFVICDIPLNYIYNQLESAYDRKQKANLFNQIAVHYEHQAQEIDKTHHLEALPKWNRAQKFYIDSLRYDENNLVATLGYIRCLIKQNKYKSAEKLLVQKHQNDNPELFNSAERWFLLGVVKRKLRNYLEADFAIRESRKLGYTSSEVDYELEIISRLTQETGEERIKLYKRMSTIHAEPNHTQYNILSVDGGGIRGLIPAIWLSELERVVGLKSSSMFHMMAGTSTGAIITAGLSLPDKNRGEIPRYAATDIVQLYTTHSDKVFYRRNSIIDFFRTSNKYTDEGRKTLFDLYFENTKLSQTLTDLIITAVQSGKSTTDLFTRRESLVDTTKNYKLSDVLMCTTAAPTYFPPYTHENLAYVDGGVQANNPSMIAYSEACRNPHINRENIFVLSLGTGDYVPDPLNPNAQRNLLFWLTKKDSILKVIFDGPQNNIDSQLNNILGSKSYQRWQVWFEKPIALDDFKKETLDNLIEQARAHFEEMNAYDSDQRLGKLIERLRGPEN